jgi:hypothetical protein
MIRHSKMISVCVFILAGASARADDGFVPLFNGRDLDGWIPVNVHPGTFFVKNGEIVTTGKPTGYMRSAKQYENFILEVDWMHVNKTEVGNSGIFVWGDTLPVPGSPFTRGIEVQVLVNLEYKDKKTGAVTASSHGDVFSIQGATCKPDRPHPTGGMRCIPSEFRAKGGGEWNHYRIIANDGTIKLHVNGKEVAGVSNCKPHRKGYLALESEGAECHFRNIRIKALPSTNPKPEEVAPASQGHVNLFTGIELLNWKAGDDIKSHWKFADHRLLFDGKGPGEPLMSEKDYGNFELVADFRQVGKSTDIVLRSGDSGRLLLTASKNELNLMQFIGDERKTAELTIGGKVENMKAAGQWNRVVVRLRGEKASVELNGKSVINETLFKGIPASGKIGLQGSGIAAEFANLFIRTME